MNIFLREMRAHTKSIIIWCLGIFLMVASSMVKYEGMSESGQSMNEILAQMPKSLQSIMGTGGFDVTKISGYYGVIFIYLLLMGTIHAAMIGASIIAKEERDKTSEFIFVKPVSRDKIITSKLSAAFVNIIILNVITLLTSITMVGYYGKGEDINNDIVKLMVGMFILQIVFLLIGTAISALSKKPKLSMSLATGILLVMFILSIAIDINSDLEPLKYFTLFKYFEAKSLMFGGEFQLVFIILSIILIVVCSSITYIYYRKKDLNV